MSIRRRGVVAIANHTENHDHKDVEEGAIMARSDDDSRRKKFKSFIERPLTPPILLSRCLALRKQRNRAALSCLVVFAMLLPLRKVLFGPAYSIRGGLLGRLTDSIIRRFVYHSTLRQREMKLQSMGIKLPPVSEPARGKAPVLPQAALVEMLIRYKQKANMLQNLTHQADSWEESCFRSRDENLVSHEQHFLFPPQDAIPKVILQPLQWIKPMRGITAISFEEDEMIKMVSQNCSGLSETYRMASVENRLYVWAFCALFQYGGYFGGQRVRHVSSILKGIEAENLTRVETSCASRGLMVFLHIDSSNPKDVANNHGLPELLLLAVSPRNPYLKCIMKKLENSNGLFSHTDLQSALMSEDDWNDLKSRGATTLLCHENNMIYASLEARLIDTHLNLEGSLSKETTKTVTIRERRDTNRPVRERKVSMQDTMKRRGIVPSWLCMRCLRARYFGSFSACSLVCPNQLKEFFCDVSNRLKRKEVTVEIEISEVPPSKTLDERVKEGGRIPRIIHQTFWEELTFDRYPDLVRLQNSWKIHGWDYRFYTDESAREYIVEHYPLRFVNAFDALIPGAYKADLFRYLVLLRDGGVYADVDVKLDTNLDAFITPEMSFFVPLDVVTDYANEKFCLWNGLIGTEPGHLFLARLIERLVSFILNRADVFDVELDICLTARFNDTEIWKSRATPELLLSGPCALGMAVNDVLGHGNLLAKYRPGWLPNVEVKHSKDQSFATDGDVLILLADKADHGAFRFTDVERNIMVASTDLPGVSKASLEPADHSRLQQSQGNSHYSLTTKREEPWGATGVYTDKMATSETIRFKMVVV